MVSPESSKKKVTNLRVQDLRLLLEKRGLDHKGVKAVLVERLQKALVDNGEDPNEVVVETPVTPKGSATKKLPTRKRTSKDKPGDEEGESDDGEEELGGDGMVVDEVTEMETDEEGKKGNANKTADNIDLDDILGSHEDDDDDVLNISLEEDQLFTEDDTDGTAVDTEKASSNQEEKMEAESSSAAEGEGSKKAVAGESLTLDTSSEAKGEGNESLVVHVDEPFMSELDEELAESAKKSGDGQEKVPEATPNDDKKLTEEKGEGPKEKGEAESTEKPEKTDKAPVDDSAKKDEPEGEGTTSKTSSTTKESSTTDKKTPSTGAANSRSKSSGSSGRSPPTKDEKERRSSGSSRPSSSSSGSSSGRNLWVSNLSRNTRAADLKASFSKYGKVVGAKVVTNARGPRAFCYGFVSMSSSSEAAKAINHLHRTELHGRTIHVERARSNMIPGASTSGFSGRKKEPSPERKDAKDKSEKKPTDKPEAKDAKPAKPAEETAKKTVTTTATEETKDEGALSTTEKESESAKEVKTEDKKDEKESGDVAKPTADADKPADSSEGDKKQEGSDKKEGDKEKDKPSSSTGKDKRDSKDRKDILSLEKIKEQRLRERQRKRERDLREMERRKERERQDALRREREVLRRRQRAEEERLRREREQLRLAQQQERLERQSIEWERLKLQQERENLQREIEQHRQMEVQLRIAAERQATLKRSLDNRNMAPRDVDPYMGDQKRRAPAGLQGRGDFNGPARGGIAISTHVVNQERPPDRFSRRDTRQVDSGSRRDNPPQGNKFSNPPNRMRDDVRRNEQGRDGSRQRPPNRNEPARPEAQRRAGPPPRRDEPPPQQQRRNDGPRRGGDNFRRDEGIKRQPERRMEASQRQPSRNEPRKGDMRDDRRGPPPSQGGQGQSRGGGGAYGGRNVGHQGNVRDGHRDRDDDRSRSGGSHQPPQRMSGGHGGDSRDNWKGGRNDGMSGPGGRSSGGHSDWKSNQRGGDRSYDRDNRSQNYDRGQGGSWGGDSRSGGRDDHARGSDHPSHRGSLLGTPPLQNNSWSSGNLDAPMNRSSGGLLPGTSHISSLMNQSQPIGSLLSSPSISGPFIGGGSVSGGLGSSGVGLMQQVPIGGGASSSYMSVGGSGRGGSLDRHRSSQSDSRFGMRRY